MTLSLVCLRNPNCPGVSIGSIPFCSQALPVHTVVYKATRLRSQQFWDPQGLSLSLVLSFLSQTIMRGPHPAIAINVPINTSPVSDILKTANPKMPSSTVSLGPSTCQSHIVFLEKVKRISLPLYTLQHLGPRTAPVCSLSLPESPDSTA